MKQETFFLTSPERLHALILYLGKIILDGSVKVTIGDAGTKSAKQRGCFFI